MAEKSFLGIFEKLMSPLHNMSIALTSIAALSVHAFLTNVFEPVTHLYHTVLLTFPLTVTLLILALVLYNLDWKKVSFLHVILSVIPLALLLMLFTYISEKYGLEKMGENGLHEKSATAEHEKKDTVLYKPTTGNAPYGMDGIKKMLEEQRIADSIKLYREQHPAWYEKYSLTRAIAGAAFFLWDRCVIMYTNYGRIRFISGILLALFLAWYIQVKAINKLVPPKKDEDKNPFHELTD